MIALVCLILGVAAPWAAMYFPYLTLGAAFASTAFLIRRKLHVALALMLVGLLFGVVQRPSAALSGTGQQDIVATGYFSAPASMQGGGYRQEFLIVTPPDISRAPIAVITPHRYELGQPYRLKLELHRPVTRLNPGETPRSPYALLSEAARLDGSPRAGGAWLAFGRMRERINQLYEQRFPEDEAALLMSVTTSGVGRMSSEVRGAFSRSGLAHMLSISGSHFAFLIAVLFYVAIKLIGFMPLWLLNRMTLYVSVRQMAAMLAIPVLAFYLGLSGGSVPALRSFVMVIFSIFGLFLGRRGSWLNILLLTAAGIVMWDPAELGSLSFQLSFLAVLFMCVILDKGDELDEEAIGNRWLRHAKYQFRDRVLAGLAAILGTAPLMAYCFHQFSLISPLANFVLDPLIGAVMVPLALFGSVVYLLTGWFPLAGLLGLVTKWSLAATLWAGNLPFASLAVPSLPPIMVVLYYIGFIALWARGASPRKWLYPVAAAGVLLVVAAFTHPPRLSVTFLDAGQADTAVIELGGKATVVIDTARSGRETGRYLRWRGISRIDALAVSHGHSDHTGGADYLVSAFDVGTLWDNGMMGYPDQIAQKVDIRTLLRGDIAEVGGARFTSLHPYDDFTAEGGDNSGYNNQSLVLRLDTQGGESFLFAGDAEAPALDDMAGLGPERLRATVLKAPHHGHVHRATAGFMGLVSPEYVVINSRKSEPLAAYAKAARVLYPPLDGAVRFSEDRKGVLAVSSYGDYVLKSAGGSVWAEASNVRRLFMAW